MPSDYVWPLSKSTAADTMNTSFGPRINRNKWDFHDGIDLPAPIGTKVYAMRGGRVHRVGPGNPGPDGRPHQIAQLSVHRAAEVRSTGLRR